jgi:hypothetical protein
MLIIGELALEAWLEAKLEAIAMKRIRGEPLSEAEKKYLERLSKREQKKLF